MVRIDPQLRTSKLADPPAADELDPERLAKTAATAARMLFDGAGHAATAAIGLPVFKPTFDRNIPHKLARDVLEQRLLPLIGQIAKRKVELRSERATTLPDQFDEIVAFAQSLAKDTDEPGALFEGVTDLGVRLERFLKDVDYISFGQVGLVQQLHAASVALRTSRALWTSVRCGYAFRDPSLRRSALRVLSNAEAVIAKANYGADIDDDLDTLEHDYTELVAALEAKTGDTIGLPDSTAFSIARRAWSYRQRLEAQILERDGGTGPLTNTELLEDVRANGVPPKLIEEEIDEHVLPALRKLLKDLGDKRGGLPKQIEERAAALEKDLEALRDAPNLHVDELEKRVVRAQEDLSKLLKDVEELVKPADGLARRLRTANDAMLGLRGLFVTLRMIQAVEDPALTTRVRSIAEDAHELMTGQVPEAEVPEALADIEARIDSLDADLQKRLHVEQIVALSEMRTALGVLRRLVRLRIAAHDALNPPMRAALAAIQDPDLTPEQRGPVFDAAMQEPLLDTTVGLAVALRQLDIGITFADAGRALEDMLRGEDGSALGTAVAKSPLAFLAQAQFEAALGRLDNFIDNIDTPEGRDYVDRSLNILRAIYEVERDQIARFAAVVPESERVNVAVALTEYMVRASVIVLEWIAAQLADPSGEAVADFLEMMVDTSADRIEQLGQRKDLDEVTPADIRTARGDIGAAASGHAKRAGVRQMGDFGSRIAEGPGGPYAERLRAERDRLIDGLSVVHTTPDAREALHDILADLNASVKMAVNLVQLFGAAANPQMDDDERERVIQLSVERMGPMFIKVMQSLVNMEGLIRAAAPDVLTPDSDPVIRSLSKLQDDVTPLPWPLIEERIRASLELPDDQPLVDTGDQRGAFVSIDEKSLKSGSIGQLHRARIRVERDGVEEEVDCVVKVLRPGVEEAFENTVRATRLTLSLVGELLRLDRNGEIFGDLKADAEARLPLIERALNGFIESFRIETDFPHEVGNLREFEKMFRADPYVIVPEVFDSHTKGGVLTMEELQGFKLSEWTKRYERAQKAPTLAEDRGRLDPSEATSRAKAWAAQTLNLRDVHATERKFGRRYVEVVVSGTNDKGERVEEHVRVRTQSGRIHRAADAAPPSRPAAEHKAKIWAQKAFGLDAVNVTGHAVEGGFRCRVSFDDRIDQYADVLIETPSGNVSPITKPPALGANGAAALRDRLRMTFMVQVIRGLLHGDPHEGNFFVMPDGKTVGLIDFGLALDVGLLDAKGPLALLAGALMENPEKMAEAVLDLSTARDLEGDDRDVAKKPIEDFFASLSKEIYAEEKKRRGPWGWMQRRFSAATRIMSRALEAIQGAGLVPLPRVIHALKAIFAMSGNIAKVAKFDERKPSKMRTLGLLSRAWLIRAMSPFFGARRAAAKRRKLQARRTHEPTTHTLARGPPTADVRRDLGHETN